MKILKNIVLVSLLSLVATNAIAANVKKSNDSDQDAGKKDYYANFYENEGSLLFKIRGFFALTSAKNTNLPAPTNAGASKPGRIAENGYGFDTAMTIFVTDNIAAEVALGLGFFKTKGSALSAALAAYGTPNQKKVGGRNQIFMVPVTMAAQYHLAPFGGIRPYVGLGYNGTYMETRSRAIKVHSTSGPVIQLGVDFIAKDDTLFTVDVRQYFLKSKLTYRSNFLGTSAATGGDGNLNSKVTWNPLVISAGFGFKF